MFGLPVGTSMIIFGVLGFWVIYTGVFVVATRSWHIEDVEESASEDPRA